MADSARWGRFEMRPDDIVVATPSKCGTTWMQHIVGMLVLGRTDLGAPLSEISPWLDMLVYTDQQIFELLDAQEHRRFVKSHTPLDGVPYHRTVTYFAVARHPLDVVMSDLDHMSNSSGRGRELRIAANGEIEPIPGFEFPPDDPHDALVWFIDNHNPPIGSGPYGLEDYCQHIGTFWAQRELPNVHLVHYQDLWDDLDGEMRRIARALGITTPPARWEELVEAATLDSMRRRADVTAPEAHQGIWNDPASFFKQGGRRDWASLLSDDEIDRFDRRLRELAGPAADWALHGRRAVSGSPGA